jgi:hypothetical protein
MKHVLQGVLRRGELHEILRTDEPENDPHKRRESSPGGIMHDCWRGKLIPHPASLKLGSPSGQYIPDPFAIPSVGERNQESLGRLKHIHWRIY